MSNRRTLRRPASPARLLVAFAVSLLLALVAAAPAGAAVESLAGSFSSGDWTEFNNGPNTTNATLDIASDSAYDGSYAAKAIYPGGGLNAYARVIQEVSWSAGDDVWYGAAFYLPVGFKANMQGEVALMRWDNYDPYGADGDIGGVVIWNSDKLARLKVGKYTGAETQLAGTFELPEGRWFWLEVHQRFSATSGQALNEVYLDGVRVGASTTANFSRPISKLRTGLVANAGIAQLKPLTLSFDRVRIGAQPSGATGGGTTEPAPTPEPAPAPSPTAPVVTLLEPTANRVFGNWLGIKASVTSVAPIARVEFLIDGRVVSTRTSAPWAYTYDASRLKIGWHKVTARAVDANGKTGQATVSVKKVKSSVTASASSSAARTKALKHRKAKHAKRGKCLKRRGGKCVKRAKAKRGGKRAEQSRRAHQRRR